MFGQGFAVSKLQALGGCSFLLYDETGSILSVVFDL